MKVKTNELIGAALDWAVGVANGAALRAPVSAKNADLEGKALPTTLYEVVQRSGAATGALLDVFVSPITVIRYGINTEAGATAPSITAIDERGDKFLGSVRDYYLTRDEAELECQCVRFGIAGDTAYSTDWREAGPIIEREGINVGPMLDGWWAAKCQVNDDEAEGATGPTSLIAAMRCFVASKLGDEVDIPEELL